MVEERETKKTGWVVPADSVEAMRDEDGALFKEAFIAMPDYNMYGTVDVKSLSPAARVLFNSFKIAMDANARRYEERCRRNQSIAKNRKPRKKSGS